MLRDDLLQRIEIAEAEHGWQRKWVDDPFSLVSKESHNIYLGHDKVTDAGNRVRYLRKGIYPVTRGELAREYLKYSMECSDKTRLIVTKKSLPLLDLTPPLYFVGYGESTVGPWAMIDITAAHFSIYRNLTLDSRYQPNETLTLGSIPFPQTDEWGMDKLARNAVMGIVTSRSVSQVWYGHLRMIPTRNYFLAPSVHGYVMDCMHAIARDMVETFGSPWWYIDAFVVRQGRAQEALDRLQTKWHVTGRILSQGAGRIWSLTDYHVGPKRTKRVRRLKPQRGQPIAHISGSVDLARMEKWQHWLNERGK